MVRTFLFCALAAAGCSFGDDRPLGGDGGPDGKPDGMDGPPMPDKDHLLLSEVKSTGGTDEFIEIWNPTNRTIDLANYYLTDINDYWRYPASTKPVPQAADFLVRFPAGATIASKGVITIAMDAATFATAYTRQATYAVDLASGAQAMRDRLVPGAMGDASITDGGEIVVLFLWDGTSDLVKDVDIMLAGRTPTNTNNGLAQKEPVDGPDADTTGSTYKADTLLLGNGMVNVTAGDQSYKRRTLETGNEAQNGNGNGITGDDETSEALKVTWDEVLTAPTPGVVPAI